MRRWWDDGLTTPVLVGLCGEQSSRFGVLLRSRSAYPAPHPPRNQGAAAAASRVALNWAFGELTVPPLALPLLVMVEERAASAGERAGGPSAGSCVWSRVGGWSGKARPPPPP